jgi:citrate lyase subunit beta / citryl-CoA lyase
MSARLLRSLLFVPGNHARRIEKALNLGADAVILDLEDAVAAAQKDAARRLVADALSRPRAPLLYVRVNALTSPWCYRDLLAVVRPGLDGLVLPKAETAADLRTFDWIVGELEREQGMARGAVDVIPIIETAKGLAGVDAICASGTRARCLAFGAADFTLDMNMQWSREETELNPARTAIALASRAAGMDAPIDTVWVRLQDGDGFRASVRTSHALGFQGRMCIHPNQIPIVHEAFAPTADELTRAAKIVAAFEQAEREGLASIRVDDQFVDYPIVAQARRLIALARRISPDGD